MTIVANRLLVELIVAGSFICGHGSGYAQTSAWKIDPAHSAALTAFTFPMVGISQEIQGIPACLQEDSRQISPWRYLGDRGDHVTTTR